MLHKPGGADYAPHITASARDVLQFVWVSSVDVDGAAPGSGLYLHQFYFTRSSEED